VNIIPQIKKVRSAIHLGRKISVTVPLAAPSFSAYLVRGHFQPLIVNTAPSINIIMKEIHVTDVILSTIEVYKTIPTHMLNTRKIIV